MPKARPGELNPKAKLTADDVRAIRRSQEPAGALATKYGVSPDTIWNIRARVTWRHIDDPSDIPAADTPGEEWRPVAGRFAGRYEVSSLGRMRSIRGVHLPTPIRRLTSNRFGYTVAVLTEHRRQRRVLLHLLIATAFIGPKPEGMQVNHKNGQKNDNRADNLEYVTPKANVRHAYALGLRHTGERVHSAKLTNAAVAIIRAAPKRRVTSASLAERFGVSKCAIDRVRQGLTWRGHDSPGVTSK